MNTPFSLELETGTHAFGDGNHPSTKGAMVALETLAHLHGVKNALDIGCGSGILALQAAYQWHVPLVASDIDAQAVEATMANAHKNHLNDLITAIRADGYHHDTIGARAPYDVIICNMLAEPLVTLARDLDAHLASEGVALLSGILRWQADMVIDAHARLGLTLLQKIQVADWTTILMQKP